MKKLWTIYSIWWLNWLSFYQFTVNSKHVCRALFANATKAKWSFLSDLHLHLFAIYIFFWYKKIYTTKPKIWWSSSCDSLSTYKSGTYLQPIAIIFPLLGLHSIDLTSLWQSLVKTHASLPSVRFMKRIRTVFN